MNTNELLGQLVIEVEKLIPHYRAIKANDQWSQGNIAVVFIAEDGNIAGKSWGTDLGKRRFYLQLANKKATQVMVTGYGTGDFETKVYKGELSEDDFPLQKPDYIGWEGGLPLVVKGVKISAAFSGFEGKHDCEILQKAQEIVDKK